MAENDVLIIKYGLCWVDLSFVHMLPTRLCVDNIVRKCVLLDYVQSRDRATLHSISMYPVAGEVDTSNIPNNITCGSQSLSTFC